MNLSLSETALNQRFNMNTKQYDIESNDNKLTLNRVDKTISGKKGYSALQTVEILDDLFGLAVENEKGMLSDFCY